MRAAAGRTAPGPDVDLDPSRDRVLTAARIRTMDPARPLVEAVAIRAGRILAVGAVDEVRAVAASNAEMVDLDGATVLPGFHDAHLHLTSLGRELSQVPLADTSTVDEALERLRDRVRQVPAGSWIEGSGFALQRWKLSAPDRALLDAVTPDHPVLLRSQDHHSGWANSRALEQAGVHAGTADPEGGRLPRREDGTPSGHLVERAVQLVARAIPEPGADALREALDAAGRELASLGVTTVHHMAFEPAGHWRALARAATAEAYPVRVWACIPHEQIEAAAAIGLATGQGGDRFTVGGAKFFVDGALGSMTAWMLEPYSGSHDQGVTVDGPEVLRERVPMAIDAGLAPVAHAIGDAAVRALVDVYATTASAWRAARLRPRIEHAQHVHPDDVERIGELGLTVSMQPLHLTFDAATVHTHLSDREARAYPIASLLRAGAAVAFGSDAPVARPDVLSGLRAAVNRTGTDGSHLGAAERIAISDALMAYTVGAARAIGRERHSGVIRIGADADLVALSRDPVSDLGEATEVVATLCGGRFTHR